VSVSSIDAKGVRRRLGERTEVDVACDVIVRLLEAQVLKWSATTVRLVCAATGIPPELLREKWVAHSSGSRPYKPPRGVPCVDPPGEPAPAAPAPAAPAPSPARPAPPPAKSNYGSKTPEGKARQGWNKRQPAPGAKTHRCGRCGHDKPLSEFSERSDKPGQLWTVCDPCRKERSANRYLSVAKEKALELARVEFEITDDDAQLVCVDCKQPFEVGQKVYGKTKLHHVTCPDADTR
jgi:hypothetical protein